MSHSKKYLDPELLARISRLELRARMVVEGFISGMHQSPYQGYSVEFAAHREYVPGDDTRHIDWRLFGRQDRLYIKQYEEETNLRTHVLLDCSASMAYPEHPAGGWKNKHDFAATLAAAIIHLLMHQQDATGLVLFDRHIRQVLHPSSRIAQLAGMLEQIEAHPPTEGTDSAGLFAELADHVRQRGLVVLVSDLLCDVNELTQGLGRLRYAGHDVIVLHVLDRDELLFPFEQNTQFEGLEPPGGQLLADPQSLRASYLQIVEEFLRRVRSACMDLRVDYALLPTHEPIEAGLTAFLAARMQRAARRG